MKEGKQPQANRRPQPWGAEALRGPGGKEKGVRPQAHSDCSRSQELGPWLRLTTDSVSFSGCLRSPENWGEGPGEGF